MIAASHPDDTTKPSRINRRRKKRWKNGLTNFYQADILNPLPHCSTRLASRNTSGTAAIMRFFYVQNFSVPHHYVGLGGAVARLAGARTGMPTSFSPAPMIGIMMSGFKTLRDIIMKNHAQTTAKSSQYKYSLFSVYHNQNLIAFNVPGVLAFRLKQRKPAAIVKFSRMEGAA